MFKWFKKIDLWIFKSIYGLHTKYEKIYHQNDDGYDLKVLYWKWEENPRYSGNTFQSRGWYRQWEEMIKDAHKHLGSL